MFHQHRQIQTGMTVEANYHRFLELTGEPTAAAMLTLAETIDGKSERTALTVKEAAKALGVSTDTIYDLCNQDRLKHPRLGRRAIRIRPEDLENLKADTTRGRALVGRCLR